MKVFLSRSKEDEQDATYKLLRSELAHANVTVWTDDQLMPGEDLQTRLADELRGADSCIFFLTAHSMASTWCAAELGAMWGAQKPIMILKGSKAMSIDGLAPQLRGYVEAKDIEHIVEGVRRLGESQEWPVDQKKVGEVRHGQFVEGLVATINTALAPLAQSIRQIEDWVSFSAPHDDHTVFGRRFRHFQGEKMEIAGGLVSALDTMLTEYPDRLVRLVLDAGTTVYPIFGLLCDRRLDKKWRNRVRIVTNNLPGVLKLLRDGREGSSPDAKLAFPTQVVAGEPSPDYWALLSETPEEQIRAFAKQEPAEIWTIGVTTGNYGKDDGRTLFVRGSQHKRFKTALIEAANEVYSLMPLGKLLPRNEKDVNAALFHGEIHESPDRDYTQVRIPDKKPLTVITTSRVSGNRMYNHFVRSQTKLDSGMSAGKAKGRTIIVPFEVDRYTGGSPVKEEELELPHVDHREKLKEWFLWDND